MGVLTHQTQSPLEQEYGIIDVSFFGAGENNTLKLLRSLCFGVLKIAQNSHFYWKDSKVYLTFYAFLINRH